MNWVGWVLEAIRNKLWRKALQSLLWPRIIKPFLIAAVTRVFDEGYDIVLRSAVTVEMMADNGEIPKSDKFKVCWELIIADAESKGVELSDWAKGYLIQIAVAEIDGKWREFE